MKKTLFGGIFMLSLVAFLATGCNTEKVETSGDDMITFNTAVGKQTRASEFTTTMLQDECSNPNTSLIVEAYYQSSGNHFRTFELDYDNVNSQWYYGSVIRYPKDDHLVYYAVYPQDVEQGELITHFHNGGDLSFDFTVADNADDQIDLIATRTEASQGEVHLVFNHILSQINFAVIGANGYTITIANDITLNNICSSGTYSFETESWSGLGGSTAHYVYDSPSSIFESEIQEELGTGSNALMLIPQDFSLEGNTSFLSFTYTITETDNPGNNDGGTANIPLYDVEWLPGTRYLIVLDFSGDYITFKQVIVEDWTDANPNPYLDPIPVDHTGY